MRVHVVDPSAYTPPYDHALCAALAARGHDVELVTARFTHGEAPAPRGYRRSERFYPLQPRGRLRVPAKLAQHVPGMLAARRAARRADVVHYQWLAVQHVDAWLLASSPRVLTAHDVLPREPRRGQRAAQRRLYARMDAVVAHTRHGRDRLVGELGLAPERVEVIPHGAFEHLAALPGRLPDELGEAGAAGRRVVLFHGLLRPYKGLDVLLSAWEGLGADAELWVVGQSRMDHRALREGSPRGVRWLVRWVSDEESVGLLRRADLVVLPYREAQASGVLHAAIALGRPVLASAVGGFAELPGAALVEPGDPGALREALRDCLAAPPAPIDPTPFSWAAVAERHEALYRRLAG